MAKRKSHTGKFTSRLVKPVNETSGSCRACSETGLGGEAACVLILSSAFFSKHKGWREARSCERPWRDAAI